MYTAYVLFSLVVAVVLAARTDRKVLSTALIFWLMAQPVLNYMFQGHIPGLPFDIHPNRVLLIVLLLYALTSMLLGTSGPTLGGTTVRPRFEKWIYIYFGAVAISLLTNFGEISFQSLFRAPAEILVFIVIYLVCKRYVTESVLDAILKAIVLLAIVASLIAIYQIAHNPAFLKTCEPRLAFGNVVRASGIFQAEYELGYFQILASMVALVRYKGSKWLYLIIPLLAFSVLITFHRLDYLILVICVGSYLFLYGSRNYKIAALVVGAFATVILVGVLALESGKNELVEGRLTEDTLTLRLHQYSVIASNLPQRPFGFGDYENRDLFRLAGKNALLNSFEDRYGNWYQRPYYVHNGYLEAAALYGIVPMIAFIALLISFFRYFKSATKTAHRYVIPAYASIIWILANLTNGISAFRLYYILLVALMAGSFVALYRVETRLKARKPASPVDNRRDTLLVPTPVQTIPR